MRKVYVKKGFDIPSAYDNLYIKIYTWIPLPWSSADAPETEENLELKGGKVLWHSKDRDEVYRKAREMRPQHSAILYTGKLLDEMALVLWVSILTRKRDSS